MTDPPSGTVTFLMTDLEGSTRLWEAHPQEMKDALAWHDDVLRRTIESHNGYIFTTAGDAFCAAFSDPMEAAASAVEVQHTISSREWPNVGVLKVRMALDTGIAEERDGDYFGPPVNRAARILSLAGGGEVLSSHTSADLLRHHLDEGIRLENLGEKRLKDVAQREQVYAVEYGPPSTKKRSIPVPAVIGGVVAVLAVGAVIAFLLNSNGDTVVAPETTTPPPETTQAAPGTTAAPKTATSEALESPLTDPDPLESWARTTIDSEGGDPSIVYVTSDIFIIAYHIPNTDEIRLRLCRDPACRAALVAVAAEGGADPSVAIGEDGFGIISYRAVAGGLNVAHCDDEVCSSATISVVDPDASVGGYSDIAIAPDLMPVISYFDEGNGSLKVAHCISPTCDAADVFVVDDAGEVGSDTSIAIGLDGFPVISYNDRAGATLKVAHCETIDCSLATVATVDVAAGGGLSTSIATGSDGLPVISNVSLDRDGVRLVQCHDVRCASTTGSDIDLSSSLGGTAVAVDADGLPFVSYYSAEGLRVAACTDLTCTAIPTYPVDPHSQSGLTSAVGIHESGLPIVIYFSGENVGLISGVPEVVVGP